MMVVALKKKLQNAPYAGTSYVLLSLSMVKRLILMDYKYPFLSPPF